MLTKNDPTLNDRVCSSFIPRVGKSIWNFSFLFFTHKFVIKLSKNSLFNALFAKVIPAFVFTTIDPL